MRILAVDDDPNALGLLVELLGRDHEIVPFSEGAGAIEALSRNPFDLVLADLGMPAPDGFDVLRATQRLAPPPPVIVITAFDSARTTLQAMRLGARDYLVKPADPDEVRAAIARVTDERSSGDASGPDTFGLVGRSDSIREVRRLIPLLAGSDETVLVMGETGCGKELVARALHVHGPRAAGPFIAHNMAATPSELAESLFFGHARGAFTGATDDHAGLFERATGGTLFLDEVDSFPLTLQAKLLRVLETGRVQRVGSGAERDVNVRVIASSSPDLVELVALDRFRADLYYRLRQLEIEIPPLRDRTMDIPELARYFLSQIASGPDGPRLSENSIQHLIGHGWPGNCRELRNAIRSAALLAGNGTIQPGHLPRELRRRSRGASRADSLATVERDHILRTLEGAGGNQSRAARVLGIDRGTLARKLRELSKPK
jgi:DNA-binding NtrC family response regulator